MQKSPQNRKNQNLEGMRSFCSKRWSGTDSRPVPTASAYDRFRWPFLYGILVILLLAAGIWLVPVKSGSAASGERKKFEMKQGMVHVWTLKAWKDNDKLCEIYRTEEGSPVGEDIRAYCGEAVYASWVSSAPCSSFLEDGSTDACEGSFLTYQGYYYRSYSTYEPLPHAGISYRIDGCSLGEWCSEKPVLTFYAQEPLLGHQIVKILFQTGDMLTGCFDTDTCEYSVPITQQPGTWLEYWAVSSFGDESEHQTIHLRNFYRSANGGEYLLDILSPYNSDDFAALTWDVFPTVSHPDEEIYQILHAEQQLATSHKLYYLAGRLIFTGEVDAQTCVAGGLLDNNMANACGEEAAAPAALDWQNRYNQQIISAAAAHQVPARVIKAVIAQESQFWPDTGLQYEYGLGSLSENGIDVLLSWDVESFLAVCIPQYDEETCSSGYNSLDAGQRAYLRGLVLRAIGTEDEIDLIARVLRANVRQVNQTMEDLVEKPFALRLSYEDLWGFTIANYHAGNTCIASGVKSLVENEQDLTFENYCMQVSTCPTACLYVERVKGYAQ